MKSCSLLFHIIRYSTQLPQLHSNAIQTVFLAKFLVKVISITSSIIAIIIPIKIIVTIIVITRVNIQNLRQTSDISRTLAGNKIAGHSDVVGTSPVGAAPTSSSFST